MVRVKLDVRKTIDQNAAVYYEKAKKARKKIEGAQKTLDEARQKLAGSYSAGVANSVADGGQTVTVTVTASRRPTTQPQRTYPMPPTVKGGTMRTGEEPRDGCRRARYGGLLQQRPLSHWTALSNRATSGSLVLNTSNGKERAAVVT